MTEPLAAPETGTRLETALRVLLAFTLLGVPLVMMRPALDPFRTPKDVFFQTMALALFATAAAGMLLSTGALPRLRAHRNALILTAAAMLWTVVTTLLSLEPEVSYFKPLTVFCLAALFVVTLGVARYRPPWAVTLVLAPAAVNAVMGLLQSADIPWAIVVGAAPTLRLRTTGLIGNPNDLGGYMVMPILAAVAATIAWPRVRVLMGAFILVLVAGLLAAQSVTPAIATVAGMIAMMALPGARMARRVGAVVLVLLAIGVAAHPGARSRAEQLMDSVRTGSASDVTSFRIPAFTVAAMMFAERPLLGAGPGVFGAHFMTYKLRMDEKHPAWIRAGNENFAEVHNDHLQLLAESGIPAYLLFLAALVMLSATSFRRDRIEDEGTRFAKMFGFPGAVAFFVLALGHFPLQLTSTVVPALYLSALCLAWTAPDEMA